MEGMTPNVKQIDPKRNAVIIEITDNGLVCHIECKDPEHLPHLTELAHSIYKAAHG